MRFFVIVLHASLPPICRNSIKEVGSQGNLKEDTLGYSESKSSKYFGCNGSTRTRLKQITVLYSFPFRQSKENDECITHWLSEMKHLP